MKRKAQCCCGECEVEVKSDPTLYALCNCNNCKKRTGSAFGLSAYFDKKDFLVISGKTHIYPVENAQGKQERHFCPQCGTTLFWFADVFEGFVGVAGGCFVDEPLPMPTVSAMPENQCSWFSLNDKIKSGLTAEDIPKEL